MKFTLTAALATVSSLALLNGAPAIAQEETSVQDTVVVTGSRIPQDPNLISSVPVQSVDDDDIRLSGEINLADIVNDIPALVSSLTAENSATGANSLNLRGLGGERSLTLVNGRRHVAGFRGTQAVDVGSIPRALVERVEVTTGGASAVYGADAVTGVVNFILKDDYEGFEVNGRVGASTYGDANNFTLDAIYGRNFDNDRGNFVVTFSLEEDNNITYGDRDWSRDNGIDTTQANPDLRFQPGELGANTPNFNAIYGGYGGLIPDANDPALAGLTLTAEEQALIARAAGAPARVVLQDPRFWLTSQEGSIAPGFGGRGTTYVDLNNNGIADCQESLGGQIGYLAGCWVTDENGNARVFEEGLIASGGLWGSGGDGGRLNFNRDTLFPETDKYVINLNTSYQFTENLRGFFEGKYVNAESTTFAEQDTFYDTLWIYPDNAFIPDNIQSVADNVGYLLLTQDPLDFSDNNESTNERETYRAVAGLEWEPVDGHIVEVSANYGLFRNTSNYTGLYLDRVFSAIDSIELPNGDIVCRSEVDAFPFYEIDYFTASSGYADGAYFSDRFYSFTPGQGECQPLNPFGTYSASQAAQDWVTSDLEDVLELEQFVLSAVAAGEFDVFENFLAGPIGYAAGVEYREETSDNQLDSLTLGILPQGTSFTPGVNVNTVSPWLYSFTSIDNTQQFNTAGSYDVYDVFAEVRLPILADRPFFEELTVDAAVRQSDYSTSGSATTWKVGGTWAPVSDLSFRATVSEAVRAPNISELFDPPLPITIAATADPCDPGNVGNGSAQREANCIADLLAAGVPQAQVTDANGNLIWNNPLTGRFSGVSGGNPNLEPETAETYTIGAIFQPSFIEGLIVTVDYWDIKIDDAIDAVGSQDILDGCLDSGSYPSAAFCQQFTRRADGGLNFLSSGQINYARLEASGVDFSAGYTFDYGENTFGARLVGSYQEKLDRFFNPLDLTEVDPEVGELQVPELSGNLTLTWDRGPLSLAFQTNYLDEQSVAEIEDIGLYGDGAFFDSSYIFDVSANYEYSDTTTFYGGVNNLTNEEPYSTQTAWPVGPRGRFFFLGVRYVN